MLPKLSRVSTVGFAFPRSTLRTVFGLTSAISARSSWVRPKSFLRSVTRSPISFAVIIMLFWWLTMRARRKFPLKQYFNVVFASLCLLTHKKRPARNKSSRRAASAKQSLVYRPSNSNVGSSSNLITFTRKVTELEPSITR